ncbi:MAG: hypothetical protein QOG64_2695, partial [Acidimicrobiaceae bacterium]|nr:hypothetical protein [Acidimicrobiaceae bacterium]
VLRIIRTGDTRLWVAVGVVVGIGLMNKHTVLFWVAGMGVGLLATPERRLLASRWLVVGGAVAAFLVLPNLVWQVQHDFATLTFLGNLRRRLLAENMTQFVPIQLGLVTLAGTVVAIVGLRWLVRRPAGDTPSGSSYRALAIGYLAVVVVLFALGGKGYYVGSMYLPLVAAGSVAVERTWSARGRRGIAVAVVFTGLLSAPVFTPILPSSALRTVKLHEVNADLGGLLGWHDVARAVAAVHRSLPPGERAGAVILTSNYSEAGAVDYWRSSLGLPKAISGHNNYWIWGPGRARQGTAVVVGFSSDYLSRYFGRVDLAAVIRRSDGLLDKQEVGQSIWICRQQLRPWPVIWPELKTFS